MCQIVNSDTWKKTDSFDFEAFARQAAEDIKAGKPMIGRDGIFTPLLKRLIEASLEGELDAHLNSTRKSEKNRHNGHLIKNLSSPFGGFEIFSPHDRNATFEPQIVEKRQHKISSDVDKQILARYGRGMSYRDIQQHVAEIYGLDVSEGAFTSEDAIVKQIYLATMNAQMKWNGCTYGWSCIRREMSDYFDNRFLTPDTLI